MSTPHQIPCTKRSGFDAPNPPASASVAWALREIRRPVPVRSISPVLSRQARFTLRVNGVKMVGNFDRLVDAVQAIRGRPLGNNYEIYSAEKRVFTFGVCLKREAIEVSALISMNHKKMPISNRS
jgi:hypothetical protein